MNVKELFEMFKTMFFGIVKEYLSFIPTLLLFVMAMAKGSADLFCVSMALAAILIEIYKIRKKIDGCWY